MTADSDTITTPEASTTGARLLREMLARVQDGRWQIGEPLPGERILMAEFAVSRVAMREALAAMRALGVLEVAHGRRSRVRPVGAEVLAYLFPLVIAQHDQGHPAKHMLEVRLALEPTMAALAATNRLDAHVQQLRDAAAVTAAHAELGGTHYILADVAFHRALADACANPLMGIIADALARYYEQSVAQNTEAFPANRQRAAVDHAAIAEAVAQGNAQAAHQHMEAHLRGTASREARGLTDESADA